MAVIRKKDIVKIFSRKTGIRQEDAKKIFNAAMWSIRRIIEEMSVGDRIVIREFGAWEMKKTKARTNVTIPHTGEQIVVAPRRRICFRPATTLARELHKLK